MVVVGPYCEISGIVMRLEHESVVCLDNHTHWLSKLNTMILFVCLWRLRSEGHTFHMHFGYIRRHFLLSDEPQIPLITVEALVTYHVPFECTPRCDINHIIIYLGFERSHNPLWFMRHFFEHDVNGRVTISTFCQYMIVKVYADVGDFIDDEDLTSFEIVFYQGVCDEEISKEEMILSDKE